MKIVTGKTGTPHVTSRQFRGMMEGIIGQDSYIITHGENLEPELMTNNKLKIKSGMMCHHGNISTVEIGTYDEVPIQNGTQGMKRIDLIVNRYSKVEGTGIEENNWVVIQGTPAAEDPAAPAYTEGNLQEGDLVDDCPVFEIHLDGINVTEVKKLLSVTPDMSTLNADLAESKAWKLYNKIQGNEKLSLPESYHELLIYTVSDALHVWSACVPHGVPYGYIRSGCDTEKIVWNYTESGISIGTCTVDGLSFISRTETYVYYR